MCAAVSNRFRLINKNAGGKIDFEKKEDEGDAWSETGQPLALNCSTRFMSRLVPQSTKINMESGIDVLRGMTRVMQVWRSRVH